MNVLPIIVRELRAEARRTVNYRLRMFSAAVLIVVLGFFLWTDANAGSGTRAFSFLTFGIFCGIWIGVPALTADCISREKREGTLGLLFLTPLKPIEIVLGKGAIHAIRSLTWIISAIPIVTIPIILGGITTTDLLWTLFFNLAALSFSLAAGLLASTLCRQWTRAIILAEIFAAIFGFAFLTAVNIFFAGTAGGPTSLMHRFAALINVFFDHSSFQPLVTTFGVPEIVWFSLSILAVGILTFAIVAICSADRLKKNWQENPPSRNSRWIQEFFCRPRIALGLLRQQNQSRLKRNPVGWLQQYSWSARSSKWAWCFIIILGVSWLMAEDVRLIPQGWRWLATGLFLSMAFSAVASFQREKQNGALELLLVTSLGEREIILGRLWGIWGQFFPAFLILLLTSVLFRLGNVSSSILHFLFIPVVGLYFAMHLKNFVVAWLLTAGLTLFIPSFYFGFSQALLLTFVTSLAAVLLYFELKDRSFALVPV